MRPSCLLLVAAAGYGKSTELSGLLPPVDTVSFDARRGAMPVLPPKATHLVVERFGDLSPSDQHGLAQWLSKMPREIGLSLTSRRPPHPDALTVLGRYVVEVGPRDLAMTPGSVETALRARGIDDADLAHSVRRVSGGWPALVHLLADALAAGEAPESAAEPGAACARYVEEVVSASPLAVRRLLNSVAGLTGPLEPDLISGLAPEVENPARLLRWLVRVGLACPTPSGCRLLPIVGLVLARRLDLDRERLVAAADWYAARGHNAHAAQVLADARAGAELADLLERSGERVLAAGGAATVASCRELLAPYAQESARVRLVLGDALRQAGENVLAHRMLAPLEAMPDGALRLALVHWQRGDYATVRHLCDRALEAVGADRAQLFAYRAMARFMLGDSDAATQDAAVAVNEACDDDCALAVAHLAAAFTLTGPRREDHLEHALAAARRAGDVLAAVRVLVNQSDSLLVQGEYTAAHERATEALACEEAPLPPGMTVAALHNSGEALLHLGRWDEASATFRRLVARSRRAGIARTASGLWGLAEVDLARGRIREAKAGFADAVSLAEQNEEQQVLAPALAGLALTLVAQSSAVSPSGPVGDVHAEARAAADRAVSVSSPETLPLALVARGRVALADNDLVRARACAERAATAAAELRCPPMSAAAEELRAAASADPAEAVAALRSAVALWERCGAPVHTDRVRSLLSRSPAATPLERSLGRAALQRLGAPPEVSAPVEVRLLGTFEVAVHGEPVPLPTWRSRQARTLFKVLLSRHGRPTSRDELSALLWPDDDPRRTSHRLSVLLSAVRGVLDPAKDLPGDRYVSSDRYGVRLDMSRLRVDVEDLLRASAQAADLAARGLTDDARTLLRELDTAYSGEPFGDEASEPWAEPLREEVRAAWLRALRLGARLGGGDGDTDEAVSCLVRLLAIDEYDEEAHLALVTALARVGRRGEARRAYERWCAARRALDAPLPDESVLGRTDLLLTAS